MSVMIVFIPSSFQDILNNGNFYQIIGAFIVAITMLILQSFYILVNSTNETKLKLINEEIHNLLKKYRLDASMRP